MEAKSQQQQQLKRNEEWKKIVYVDCCLAAGRINAIEFPFVVCIRTTVGRYMSTGSPYWHSLFVGGGGSGDDDGVHYTLVYRLPIWLFGFNANESVTGTQYTRLASVIQCICIETLKQTHTHTPAIWSQASVWCVATIYAHRTKRQNFRFSWIWQNAGAAHREQHWLENRWEMYAMESIYFRL